MIIRDIEHLHGDIKEFARMALGFIKHYQLPFAVFETLRSHERQQELFNEGKTTVLHSKHETGDAVDIVFKDKNGWSWANDKIPAYKIFGEWMLYEAEQRGLKIEWGGHWHSFKDYVHFQNKEG